MRAAVSRPTLGVAATPGPVRTLRLRGAPAEQRASLLAREWLVTNGLGGYAAGTIGGAPSRALSRHPHRGIAAAARAATHAERRARGAVHRRRAHRTPHGADSRGYGCSCPSTEFRLEVGLPVWRYDLGGVVVEKRLLMPHGQNTVHVLYELKSAVSAARLDISIAVHHRSHDDPVGAPLAERPSASSATAYGYELGFAALPPLKFMVDGARCEYTERQATWSDRRYAVEESRGYMDTAGAWTPGVFTLDLDCYALCNVHRVDGAVGGRYGHARRRGARGRARAPPRVHRGRRSQRAARSCGRARVGSGSVHRDAGRPHGRGGTRARSRRRRALGDRRLPLVHGLGQRHDDQPRRAHTAHGTHRGSERNPAHVHQLHSRWPRAEPVSRGR